MSRIYLIPGLGADCRIYKNLDLAGHDVFFVNWIAPDPADTLSTYAQKLIDYYKIQQNSILIGNSMGGMVAIEIAKLQPMAKTILISSIKSSEEASSYFSFFRSVPLYKYIPTSLLVKARLFVKYIFGSMLPEDQHLFEDMYKNTSPAFIKWAMGAILKWKNTIIPDNVYHITGSNDKVFNCRKAIGAQIIKNGTHIMIFDRAAEINTILKRILN